MTARRLFAAVLLLVALGAGLGAATVVTPAGGDTGAACTKAERAKAQAALARFIRSMAPARKAFNRTHTRPKDRAAFARKQRATLNRLRAAASCTVETTAETTVVTTPGSACAPSIDAAGTPTNGVGPLPNAGVRGIGQLKAVMLFVDFPDAAATETTRSLYDELAPHSERNFARQSFGRLDLRITEIPRWYRMSKNARDYGLSRSAGTTFYEHRAYMQEAMNLADADVDFRGYQLVYVVATMSAATVIDFSPAFVASHDGGGRWGLRADGTVIYGGATFGGDLSVTHVLEHETGHAFGLPDYYSYGAASDWSQLYRFAGGWSLMSAVDAGGGEFFAWDKYREGWIDPSQIRCQDEPGSTTQTLTPVETPGGMKMIVAKTGPSTAYVAEVRSLTGGDANLCSAGVLVYTLDARVPSGSGPLQVVTPHPGTNPTMIRRCNVLYDAPLRSGEAWEDGAVRVEVLSPGPRGSYNVRVTRK